MTRAKRMVLSEPCAITIHVHVRLLKRVFEKVMLK